MLKQFGTVSAAVAGLLAAGAPAAFAAEAGNRLDPALDRLGTEVENHVCATTVVVGAVTGGKLYDPVYDTCLADKLAEAGML
ncbi:hypothetical protein C1701_13080 [Actinoalloteichus sp. AHMU CJ021]|uniref:Secreted protein n=1 Tax=Actinoalloteichus caeruleus DSM 43889 TaxID=1120930 RepID=A0ABT1JLI9_ACTCY|nr:hypothetical protein [Actinoalloteichus caeruleus]AUS79134.1 hypothetical protein C1701_13080 [Actinoalloteichus sp. AHMU CJ021]MCP2333382.1 hypothetical protein [Actinoalloteichus caeruleus DSM 43889]